MNACIDPNAGTLGAGLEPSLRRLKGPVKDLIHNVTRVEPTVTQDRAVLRLTAPLDFPDAIGSGTVVAQLFRYRDDLRLDIRVEHNRVFAGPDGTPTERRCFLNDYIASVTLATDSERLPEGFVREVVAGIQTAREAVRRHNKTSQAPWNEIRVAALSSEPV